MPIVAAPRLGGLLFVDRSGDRIAQPVPIDEMRRLNATLLLFVFTEDGPVRGGERKADFIDTVPVKLAATPVARSLLWPGSMMALPVKSLLGTFIGASAGPPN